MRPRLYTCETCGVCVCVCVCVCVRARVCARVCLSARVCERAHKISGQGRREYWARLACAMLECAA